MKVIVTGASRGIGRGIAEVLGRGGFEVGLTARSSEALEQVAEAVDGSGGRACTAAADLRDPQQISAAIASLIEQLGGVDALINNAGVVIRKPTLEIEPEEWRAMIETNLNGVFYATRAVLDAMIEQGRGHIVNVSSISGYYPLPGGSGYAASKYGVTGFSESLMQEVRDHGVKVTTVFPGSVDSESHRHGEADHSWKLTPEEVGQTCRHVLETGRNNVISRVEMRPLSRPPK